MTRKVHRHAGVETDFIDLASYLWQQDQKIAIRFLDEVENSISEIARHPGIGSPKLFAEPTLSGIRSWRIKGFPNHIIYYRINADLIFLLAVLHGARDLPRSLAPRTRKP